MGVLIVKVLQNRGELGVGGLFTRRSGPARCGCCYGFGALPALRVGGIGKRCQKISLLVVDVL